MKYGFGNKIRLIRERKKMTMRQVAEAVGVSESLISQIERNKVSPAIDTLLEIADFLDVDFEFLFADFKKTKSVNLVRYEQRNKIMIGGVTYEQLCKTVGTEEHGIEAYYMEVQPGQDKGDTEYGHKGKELGIILEGHAVVKFGTKEYELGPGDSISFDSDVPHMLTNSGETPVKAIWVTTPPKMFFKES